jgi:transposase InsO family protein
VPAGSRGESHYLLRHHGTALGAEIPEDRKPGELLYRLGPGYAELRALLEAQGGPTVATIKRAVSSYHLNKYAGKPDQSNGGSTALLGGAPAHWGGAGVGSDRRGPADDSPSGGDTRICYRCGLTGHIRPQCKETRACNRCGEIGHIAPNHDRVAKFKGSGRGGGGGGGQGGKKGGGRGGRGGRGTSGAHIGVALVAGRATTRGNRGSQGSIVWLIDSGATEHIVSDITLMRNFTAAPRAIAGLGGIQVVAEGHGDVVGWVQNASGSYTKVTITRAYLVRDGGYNLLSYALLVERGARPDLVGRKMHVGDQVFPIACQERLYRLSTATAPPDQQSPETTPTKAVLSEAASQRYHERLGHLHFEAVKQLSEVGVGIPPGIKVPHGLIKPVCRTCQLGKHKRSTFKPIADRETAPTPFSKAHVDLFSVEVPSNGGARYCAVFRDDKTRWLHAIPLKTKNLLEAVRKYVEMVRLAGHKAGIGELHVRVVQSDRGGEFIGQNFHRLCAEMGIKQVFSAPYTPEQNGIAERAIQTVVNMARCMRLHAGLPKGFWVEAVQTAVDILNISSIEALGGQTPHFALYGKNSSVEHLRVFGCRAYVHLYDHQRRKMGAKAWEGILLGYDPDNRRCYRVWDPVRRKPFYTAHVTFDEGVFPAKLPAPFFLCDKLAATGSGISGLVPAKLGTSPTSGER